MSVTSEPTTAPSVAKPRTPSFFETLLNHPAGFWFIFWGELAERCSYYGMMSILARFIADSADPERGQHAGLGLGQAAGNTWVSLFKAACYFLPLAGGILADQFLGKYRLIVIFSIPYILGHIILADESYWLTIVALGLLAMGSGVIKPNISTLMGMTYDQKRPGNDQLRSMAFGMFYMAINIGAAMSYAFLPQIRDGYGYSIAFMCPAVLMAISFAIFAAGKPFYAVEKIERRPSTPQESSEKVAVLMRVGGLFLVVTFFWAVFDQSHTTWVYFAQDFTDLSLFGQEFSPEQFGTLNPVLIVLFVPLFQVGWTLLDRFAGIRVRPTDKMILGFVLTALTMGVMAFAGYMAGSFTEVADDKGILRRHVLESDKVTIWWEVLAFVLLTSAEVLISVTGLELAFILAPPSMKSFVTAMWLLTVGIANLVINAPLGRLYAYMPPGPYFAILTGIMIVVMVAFFFVAQRFTKASQSQEDNRKAAALASLEGQAEDGFLPAPATGGIIDKARREGIVDPNKKDDPSNG